jgi:hypothetical protein
MTDSEHLRTGLKLDLRPGATAIAPTEDYIVRHLEIVEAKIRETQQAARTQV